MEHREREIPVERKIGDSVNTIVILVQAGAIAVVGTGMLAFSIARGIKRTLFRQNRQPQQKAK